MIFFQKEKLRQWKRFSEENLRKFIVIFTSFYVIVVAANLYCMEAQARSRDKLMEVVNTINSGFRIKVFAEKSLSLPKIRSITTRLERNRESFYQMWANHVVYGQPKPKSTHSDEGVSYTFTVTGMHTYFTDENGQPKKKHKLSIDDFRDLLKSSSATPGEVVEKMVNSLGRFEDYESYRFFYKLVSDSTKKIQAELDEMFLREASKELKGNSYYSYSHGFWLQSAMRSYYSRNRNQEELIYLSEDYKKLLTKEAALLEEIERSTSFRARAKRLIDLPFRKITEIWVYQELDRLAHDVAIEVAEDNLYPIVSSSSEKHDHIRSELKGDLIKNIETVELKYFLEGFFGSRLIDLDFGSVFMMPSLESYQGVQSNAWTPFQDVDLSDYIYFRRQIHRFFMHDRYESVEEKMAVNSKYFPHGSILRLDETFSQRVIDHFVVFFGNCRQCAVSETQFYK